MQGIDELAQLAMCTRGEYEIKCSKSLAFCLVSPTRLINTIKHDHSCKILYVIEDIQLLEVNTLCLCNFAYVS